jgi:hypothetical protein
MDRDLPVATSVSEWTQSVFHSLTLVATFRTVKALSANEETEHW